MALTKSESSAGTASRPDRSRAIPVAMSALIDRLTVPSAWPPGKASEARRLFRYLEYWRRQQYTATMTELEQTYEPFSPDSDLIVTRTFTAEELAVLQQRVIGEIERVLAHGDYTRVSPDDVELLLSRDSAHYGLDLRVNFADFEECLIYYRGAAAVKSQRRTLRSLFRKEAFDVPTFQRLFVLFKTKPVALRGNMFPPSVSDGKIYIKLFRNIPRTDLEMTLPNTVVRFRTVDKAKVLVSMSSALVFGFVGTIGKLALVATNPLAAAGAIFGLSGIAFRQAVGLLNQKQRYLVVTAQTHYFHSIADNLSVIQHLANRAAEEDVKEEALLYSVLAKETARRTDIAAISEAVERYLTSSFGVEVEAHLSDTLDRLLADGLVAENSDGSLTAVDPSEAAARLDAKFDDFLESPGSAASKDVAAVSAPLRDEEQEADPALSGAPSPSAGSIGRHVFVSYATADRETATRIVVALEAAGHACWYAPRDVPVGSDYQEAIVEALEAARALVLVLSEAANDSVHVKREVNMADEMRKAILPLRLGATKARGALRYQLNNRQYIDLGDDVDVAVATLTQRLGPA